MTAIVHMVRHGQTDSNVKGLYMGWSDEDMNETGYAQVSKLSSRLASLPIASVYTSPLKRAYSTAAVLAKSHNLKLEPLEDLTEINLGDWQGLHVDEIKRRWPELWQRWRSDPSEFSVPNGENFTQVAERAARAYDEIIATNEDRQVLIVTHEIIVKLIVTHVLGAPSSIYRRFEVANASLSTVRVRDGHNRLVMLNDTSHLES